MSQVLSREKIPELTLRGIILAIVLTILLAMSNAYLALKLGMLTSASIPAAIISMGILRLFKNTSILENNAVQTAASAGEAVAGGIVYTIPALIIIQYWHRFDYWTNFFIALSGGILGVLFSIPLRRILVHDKTLKFPEGQAIAEILKSSSGAKGIKDIIYGSILGGLFELLQVGFKIFANSWNSWFVYKRTIFGIGLGFSATMLGAGYLIGFDMALSVFMGAVLSWLVALPISSHIFPAYLLQAPVEKAANLLWAEQLRYLGIGAMLFAGTWTFLKLIKPLANNIYLSLKNFITKQADLSVSRVEKDISLPYLLLGIVGITIGLFYFFPKILPLQAFGTNTWMSVSIVGFAVTYILIIGFLFSVITAYFSGMVGVSASPGSSVVIAGILFAGWLLMGLIAHFISSPMTEMQIAAGEAIVIVIGSIVTGIAAIANDNTQDLKVGQLVGATPWKQQLMLLLGVVVSSLIIPPVMQLLFNVYGIAGVMPRVGMDISQSLPAPVAALLAAITKAVFQHSLPWIMLSMGAVITALILLVNTLFKLHRFINISILGVAMGMYLPLSSSTPLFIGGLMALLIQSRFVKGKFNAEDTIQRKQVGTRIACGLVAGSAILDILLAIPFSIFHSPDVLRLVHWSSMGVWLSIVSIAVFFVWLRRRVCY